MQNLFKSLLLICLTSCFAVQDISDNLQYPDNTAVKAGDIDFTKLEQAKSGKSCIYAFAFILPFYGTSSVSAAAQNGGVQNVQFFAKITSFAFPITNYCTVVYGDIQNLDTIKIKK
jgi:hypothetical protein